MLRAAAAGLIFALGVGVIAMADRPVIRYGSAGNAEECLAHQILHLPAETNVILLGSSRIRRGVSPDLLQEILGEPHPVYNLGRPGVSTARNYVLLRELYAQGHRPEIVVMESALELVRGAYDVTKARNAWPWQTDTASVFSFADHLQFPAIASDAGLMGQLGLISHGLSKKVAESTARYLSGEAVDAELRREAPETVCMLPQFDDPKPKDIARQIERKAEEKARLEAQFGDSATSVDDRFNYGEIGAQRLEIYYLEKVRALAEAHGSQLYVVRLHSYLRPPYTPEVTQQMQALIPEALIPDADVIRQTSENFIDRTHLGPEARAIYTTWLGGAIRERQDKP